MAWTKKLPSEPGIYFGVVGGRTDVFVVDIPFTVHAVCRNGDGGGLVLIPRSPEWYWDKRVESPPFYNNRPVEHGMSDNAKEFWRIYGDDIFVSRYYDCESAHTINELYSMFVERMKAETPEAPTSEAP